MLAADNIILAGPDCPFGTVVARNSEQVGSNPGRVICHRVCAYTVLQAVPRPGVCSAVYDNVHYKVKTLEVIR